MIQAVFLFLRVFLLYYAMYKSFDLNYSIHLPHFTRRFPCCTYGNSPIIFGLEQRSKSFIPQTLQKTRIKFLNPFKSPGYEKDLYPDEHSSCRNPDCLCNPGPDRYSICTVCIKQRSHQPSSQSKKNRLRQQNKEKSNELKSLSLP